MVRGRYIKLVSGRQCICLIQLTWLNPTESQYNIQWDDQMCPGGSRKLFAKAYKEALTVSEQEELIQEFKSDVKLVYRVGLTPQKVRLLVLDKTYRIFLNLILPIFIASSAGGKEPNGRNRSFIEFDNLSSVLRVSCSPRAGHFASIIQLA